MIALAVGVVLRLGDRGDGDVQALLLQRRLARLELREEAGGERQSASTMGQAVVVVGAMAMVERGRGKRQSLLWVKPWCVP